VTAGWDVTETGREARFYHLTAEGTRELDTALANWNRYVIAMGFVLDAEGPA